MFEDDGNSQNDYFDVDSISGDSFRSALAGLQSRLGIQFQGHRVAFPVDPRYSARYAAFGSSITIPMPSDAEEATTKALLQQFGVKETDPGPNYHSFQTHILDNSGRLHRIDHPDVGNTTITSYPSRKSNPGEFRDISADPYTSIISDQQFPGAEIAHHITRVSLIPGNRDRPHARLAAEELQRGRELQEMSSHDNPLWYGATSGVVHAFGHGFFRTGHGVYNPSTNAYYSRNNWFGKRNVDNYLAEHVKANLPWPQDPRS